MKVFKFGGGVLTDPVAIDTLYKVLNQYRNDRIVVVVSAFGKTTNSLEYLLSLVIENDHYEDAVKKIEKYFEAFLDELFPAKQHSVYKKLENLLAEVSAKIEKFKDMDYDLFYDQVVSYGEVISSTIVSEYLALKGLQNKWLDARKMLITSSKFRNADVLDDPTIDNIRIKVSLDLNSSLFITQGFIGGTENGLNTTLGREGSDYTAALIAGALDVEEVVFWKDVGGIFNSDPHIFKNTIKIKELNYSDASELTAMGAKVLHPKTIQPLAEHNIPFEVRLFEENAGDGTRIFREARIDDSIPIIVKKKDQVLLTILNKTLPDFSIDQRKILSKLFYPYGEHIGFQKFGSERLILSIDYMKPKLDQLIKELSASFKVFYNKNLALYIIKNFTNEIIEDISKSKQVFHVEKEKDKVYILAAGS